MNIWQQESPPEVQDWVPHERNSDYYVNYAIFLNPHAFLQYIAFEVPEYHNLGEAPKQPCSRKALSAALKTYDPAHLNSKGVTESLWMKFLFHM